MKMLRNTLFVLVALFVFASCSKKEGDISPANLPVPGVELVGQYKVIYYRLNNESQQNLPAGRSIIIKFASISSTQAHLLIDDTLADQPSSDDDYGNVDLVELGAVLKSTLALPKSALMTTARLRWSLSSLMVWFASPPNVSNHFTTLNTMGILLQL